MSQIPNELKYVDTHEWLRLEADGSLTIGITDHAQQLLGDVVYVELPAVGSQLEAGQSSGVVESVKAASDIYAPIAGEVVAINDDLAASPEWANEAPYGKAWFFRLKPANAADLATLMDAAAYRQFIE